MLSSRKLLKLMPVSTRSTLEKCFANLPGLRALYMPTTAMGPGVHRTSVEKALFLLGVYF